MAYKLTWHEARNCWKKFFHGKLYYLGKGKCRSKSDYEGYQTALAEWKRIQGGVVETEKAQELFETDPKVCEQIGLMQQRKRYLAGEYPNKTFEEACEIEDALTNHRRMAVDVPVERTAENQAEAFLKFKAGQVKASQQSGGRLRNIRTYLNRFVEFVGKSNKVETITAVTLSQFYAKLMEEISGGLLGDMTARDAMQVAKQFIRRLASLSIIPLPNNIGSSDLSIRVTSKAIQIWDLQVLKGVLKDAPEPLRLYLLLMANCGMTQKDVASLLPLQVDWERGLIKRKRTKTQKWENVPMVSYRLWKDTFDLLKKFGKREGVRVLSAPDGSPLVYDDVTKNDKSSKGDKVKEQWNAWLRVARVANTKDLSDIRKTSSSLLGTQSEFARFGQYFLAQSPKTVADKYYIQPAEAEFEKALAWLGKQYGYETARTDVRKSAAKKNL